MSDAPNVRNVKSDKADKAPDVAHGAPGQAHSSGANEPDALTCAVKDIGLTILALRDCDKAGEPVPSRLRARIRVMEDELFNVPTAEGAERRRLLS